MSADSLARDDSGVYYKFPADYTLGSMSIEIISGIVAGAVIAGLIRPHTA